ncbi:general stress protein [Streptomyces sp. TRM70308]|uniref:general stress protein n=1 Tax=Streptomyces sp. TRM70308 TaxID=3131932 RepID=UPI003D077C77
MSETDRPASAPSEISMAWNTVASFETYPEAQAAVDQLSDDKFPVEHLDIIGSDLRLVEHVTGRFTKGSAAAAGAASGAWFGLFIGLLVGLFTTGPAWLGLILGGILIGAVWGAIFGYVSHAATGGRRDFSSERNLVAARYDVVARGGHAQEARTALARAGGDAAAD